MRSALLLVLTLTLASCAGTNADHRSGGNDTDRGPRSESARGSGEDDDAKWKLEVAEREFEIATLEAEAKLSRSERRVADAERKVKDAELELAGFEVGRAIQLDREQLSLDRGSNGVEQSEMELAELIAMYEEDDFATTTKELVILRGRMRLEFSRRGFELDQREHAHLVDHELARKHERAVQELDDARFELGLARHDHQVTQMEVGLSLRKQERELQELREKAGDGDDA
ncbi:hypothetical protein Pla163_18560 [Planctomycetes bacterium Pla163]|uniref:Chromosome partition protein Smc n=1 Tax=Rohdeia mirabilis TaxID=2528008 RepID=A0A518CZU7_9BACT|nr:hypothetical protein Pla163_18560 [Planctomycetes bacterium Pla163]